MFLRLSFLSRRRALVESVDIAVHVVSIWILVIFISLEVYVSSAYVDMFKLLVGIVYQKIVFWCVLGGVKTSLTRKVRIQ